MKIDAAALPALFEGGRRIVAARGKKSVAFDLADGVTPDIAAEVLGRSGTLRAPTARVGRDWLVGFGEPAWEAFFGG